MTPPLTHNIVGSGLKERHANGLTRWMFYGDSITTGASNRMLHGMVRQNDRRFDGGFIDSTVGASSPNFGFYPTRTDPATLTNVNAGSTASFDPDETGNSSGDHPYGPASRRETVMSGDGTSAEIMVKHIIDDANWAGPAGSAPFATEVSTWTVRPVYITGPFAPDAAQSFKCRVLVDGTIDGSDIKENANTASSAVAYADQDTTSSPAADDTGKIEARTIMGASVTETTGDILSVHGARIFRKDAQAPGYEVSSISFGGATPQERSNGTTTYAAADMATMLQAIAPNVIVVWLGANGTNTRADYKSRMQTVVSQLRTGLATAGIDDAIILLVTQYETSALSQANAEMKAEVLHEIATEGVGGVASDLAMINIQRYMEDTHGDFDSWKATYLADNVHPNLAGADEIIGNGLLALIESALEGGRGTRSRMRVR